MPFTFTMPKLSPTMEIGVIAKWHKKEGDHIDAGEVVLEVTTDKATVEHSALDEGWLKKILVSEGEEAKVNQPIAIFTTENNESIEGYEPVGIQLEGEKPIVEEKAVEQSDTSQAKEVETPSKTKATGSMNQPAFEPTEPLKDYTFEFPGEQISKRIAASPLAKKLAKERHLDITTVKGSGPGGRVVSQDLEKAQSSGIVSFSRREVPQLPPGSYEEIPLSPVQKIVGERLQAAKALIPHFYVTQEIDADPLIKVREELKNLNVKLSFNDFIMKACALALKIHPNINSGFNTVNNTGIHFKTIDIAVAVSLDEGLITPIVRHADFKNIGEIAVEVKSLAKRARDGKLAMQEFQGGSFTVSNAGMYGITELFPVINPPQSAILGVGGIKEVARVKGSVVVPGNQISLVLAADHRSVNGAAGADFLRTLKSFLENPSGLLL